MNVIHTIAEFRIWRRAIAADAITPFVPTMGALHEGHASLVRQAREMVNHANGHGNGSGTGAVLASIFVNPTQFGPQEDFSKYPRTLDADLALLAAAGCDAVLVPSPEELYPRIKEMNTEAAGAMMNIEPGDLGRVLEGTIRPGHFRGVCLVVAKLLNITQPTHLLLGQKDYQQQAVLRQMCVDLNMPVEVVTCPTMRKTDGLAMSSRNRYLSAEERRRAVGLIEALRWGKQAYDAGERRADAIEAAMEERLNARGLVLQYAVAADAQTLVLFHDAENGQIAGTGVLLIAAKLGHTRLIDNMLL